MVEPGCSDKHAARLQLGPLIFAKLAAYSPLLRAWGCRCASHTVAAPLAAAEAISISSTGLHPRRLIQSRNFAELSVRPKRARRR